MITRICITLIAFILFLQGMAWPDDSSSLFDAIYSGNVEAVKTLVEKNPKLINAKNESGYYPIQFAANCNNAMIVDLLISRGADINAKDDQGRTALFGAADSGNVMMLTQLISKGTDVNARDNDGSAPIHEACTIGNVEMVKYLVSK